MSVDSGSPSDASAPDAAMGPDATPAPLPTVACTDTIASVYTEPTGLVPFDLSRRGEVVRCAYDRTLTTTQIQSALVAAGYASANPTSPLTVYRIAYRTQRLAAGKITDGISTALVLLPQTLTGPLVVAAHGTVGIAASCAPSKQDLLGHDAWDTDRELFLGLSANGAPVVAPDYAGFGFGSVSGWSLAEDEAHSLLDATRAVRLLTPAGMLPQAVAIVGHSQGGHAALSAQALSPSYGLDGRLVGVAAFAPFWGALRAWGAMLYPNSGYTTASTPAPIAFGMFYFYTHGELYDGAGGGLTMFSAGKQSQVASMLTTMCLGDVIQNVTNLGATPSDFYDSTFANSVGACAGAGFCFGPPATTWAPHFAADRPSIAGGGQPLLVWQGGQDTTVTPERAQCGFDKLANDLKAPTANPATTVNLCEDSSANHVTILGNNLDFVKRWIAARAGSGAEPPPCVGWTARTCVTPPPNQD
jgi:pimeloyl-ACP methyl ester carboxylesterase